MRSKRPDLARKALAAAGEWERAEAPSADLRINQGLIGLRGGLAPDAQARLREGVDLAGGGAVGWFRAALHDALITPLRHRHVAPIDDELARALRGVPSKPDIVAIAALLAAPDVRADPKATSELGWKFCAWLAKAADTVLSVAEFHAVAEAIARAQRYDVLAQFAVAGKRREPNERLWRFYEIVARTNNHPDRMLVAEEEDIDAMCQSRAIAEDRHGRSRIDRYLDGSGDDPVAKRRSRRLRGGAAECGLDELDDALKNLIDDIAPYEVMRLVRARGREGAITALADRLGKLPSSAALPRPILDMLAKTMVAAALGDASPPF